jgi:nicotinamide-nucleotide amidase
MKAAIISIGDELLIGQTINTNASWMGEKLTDVGITVSTVYTISDDRESIIHTLNQCVAQQYKYVFITGGLGPTKDDITKKVLCEYFNDELISNQEVLDNVHKFFKAYDREVKQINKDQALVPSKAKVFVNEKGTAPGMWMTTGNMVVVSMPGIPKEMKWLMEERVIPQVLKDNVMPVIYRKTLLTQGIGESFIAELIEDIEDGLPSNIKLAYLPSAGMVKLRLTANGTNKDELSESISTIFEEIIKRIPSYIYGWDEERLENVIVNYLINHNLTLSTAESITGGLLASTITRVTGSSKVFKGSVVAYQNEIKEKVLGVDKDDLLNYGAVSEQVVIQMAKGVKKLTSSDLAIATSGFAGPDGGTEDCPVGTVWIALAIQDEIVAKKFNLGVGREGITLRAVRTALGWLKRELAIV